MSYSQISVPTSLTDAHAADGANSAALESVKGKRNRRRREFNRLLELVARLCAGVLPLNRHCALQLESITTTAPVLHRLEGPSVCLSACPSVRLFCLPFLSWELGGKEENG